MASGSRARPGGVQHQCGDLRADFFPDVFADHLVVTDTGNDFGFPHHRCPGRHYARVAENDTAAGEDYASTGSDDADTRPGHTCARRHLLSGTGKPDPRRRRHRIHWGNEQCSELDD